LTKIILFYGWKETLVFIYEELQNATCEDWMKNEDKYTVMYREIIKYLLKYNGSPNIVTKWLSLQDLMA
jgi:hypothetical protein